MRKPLLCAVVLLVALPARAEPGSLGGRSSGARVWLSGGYRTQRVSALSATRELTLALGMSMPWDHWLLGQRSYQLARTAEASERPSAGDQPLEVRDATEPPQQSEKPAAKERSETTALEPTSETRDRAQASTPAVEMPAVPAGQRNQLLGAEFVRETLRRALVAQGFGRASKRDAALSSRARWSAVLPDLRLRAARATDQSLRLAPTLNDPYRYTRDGGTDLVLEARASWQLSRLLFASSELAVERFRLQRAARRQKLVESVLEQLFRWQRAHLNASDPGLFVEQRQQAELERLEAELTLNVLTSGWFSSERTGL